ncbi:hypothetical protein EBQ34_01250 [Vandammella animalimorsus]|uniref:Uncharacterized protein n=2 Tax=Vandammella animalimorsus TaxID=2029117 RepID=A0A3M6RUG0_9BURK|nr:hypothetical protein EBQ34_01250 [Vandammella animalimorsus]
MDGERMSNPKKPAARQAAPAPANQPDANPVQAAPVQPDDEVSLAEAAALVGIELGDVLAWRCYDGRIVVVTRWGAKLIGDREA